MLMLFVSQKLLDHTPITFPTQKKLGTRPRKTVNIIPVNSNPIDMGKDRLNRVKKVV